MLNSEYVIPSHIAFIMDGNGRWATKRNLPRYAGHIEGAKTFKTILKYCSEINVKHVTFYAFSTENWKRPKVEINAIMKLLNNYLDEIIRDHNKYNYRFVFIGDRSVLSDSHIKKMNDIERITFNYTKMIVNIAINYGGRQEIINAVKNIIDSCNKNVLDKENIDVNTFSDYLYTRGQPDPDLIIRPSGEKRLSNFLLWQSSYSELWFDDVLWPDFSTDDLDRAIIDYNNRNRRYGGI